MRRLIIAGLVALLPLAVWAQTLPTAGQYYPPGTMTPTAASGQEPLGFDSVTNQRCMVGETITCQLQTNASSGGSSAVTIANGANVTAGALADTACATDNGTCTLQALIKRINQRLTTLNATLNAPMQQTGGTVALAAGSAAIGSVTQGTPPWEVNALTGDYATCSIVDIGCGASPGANTVLHDTKALVSSIPVNGRAAQTASVPVAEAYATTAQTASVATSKVITTSANQVLRSFVATPDSTLSAATWYLLALNATSDPGNGSVSPVLCYQVPAGAPFISGSSPALFSTGIVLVASTTGCFTETQSAHAFIEGSF